MGAWGPALYSDDTTCEVRDAYIDQLKRGVADAHAKQAILDRFGDLLDDREVACLVYFALAETAWKYGRLNPQLRATALELIALGGDIHVWERDAHADAPARRRALLALEKRLLAPQPPRKELRLVQPRPKKVLLKAQVGTVFLLALPDGQHGALVLIGYLEQARSIEPIFAALNWRGGPAPSAQALSGAAPYPRQLGVLALDGRNNPFTPLVETSIKLRSSIPFAPDESVTYMPLGRIAEEIAKADTLLL